MNGLLLGQYDSERRAITGTAFDLNRPTMVFNDSSYNIKSKAQSSHHTIGICFLESFENFKLILLCDAMSVIFYGELSVGVLGVHFDLNRTALSIFERVTQEQSQNLLHAMTIPMASNRTLRKHPNGSTFGSPQL